MDDTASLRILVLSKIDPATVRALQQTHDVLVAIDPPRQQMLDLLPGREIVIFRSGVLFDAEAIDCADSLELLLRAGAGLDNVDLAHVRTAGIRLEHVPEPGARSVAELTIGLMLALARRILVGDRALREGVWAKNELVGDLLLGKRLGIVGAGSIGRQVGRLGAALGMEVVGCVAPELMDDADLAAALESDGIDLAPFQDVVSSSDFVTLHVPLTPATRGLFGRDVLSGMKPGAYLVNMARGGVVDEEALSEVLREGEPLAGAALDVHENEHPEDGGAISPLVDLPNVVLTPHLGSMAAEVQAQIGARVVELVDEVARSLAAR